MTDEYKVLKKQKLSWGEYELRRYGNKPMFYSPIGLLPSSKKPNYFYEAGYTEKGGKFTRTMYDKSLKAVLDHYKYQVKQG